MASQKISMGGAVNEFIWERVITKIPQETECRRERKRKRVSGV